jgi:hypothetical protein
LNSIQVVSSLIVNGSSRSRFLTRAADRINGHGNDDDCPGNERLPVRVDIRQFSSLSARVSSGAIRGALVRFLAEVV